MSRNSSRHVLSHWPEWLQPIGDALGRVPFSRFIWKHFHRLPGNSLWSVGEFYRRKQIGFTTSSRTEHMLQYMATDRAESRPGPQITITLSSRKLGNRDNHLGTLIESFVAKTAYPDRIEFLVKADDDDHLQYFYGLKRKFSTLNLRIYVSPRGRGYYDLPHYNSFLIDRASPTSKAWLGLSDDAIFCREGWDSDLYDLIDRGGEFIAGSKPSDSQINVIGPLPIVMSKPGYYYDAEPYPIVSWGLIESLRAATQDLEGWTELGNIPATDIFLAGIDDVLRNKHHLNVYHQIEQYCTRRYSRVGWFNNAQRAAAVSAVLEDFWDSSNVEVRSLIADRVYQRLTLMQTGAAPS